MSRDDVVQNLGTIARSGRLEFEPQLRERAEQGQMNDLIGRFGVGFYSCFMVADKVTLVTRGAGEAMGTSWASTGDINLQAPRCVGRSTRDIRHTCIEGCRHRGRTRGLHEPMRLAKVVKRYADFIAYPIVDVRPTDDAEVERSDARDAVGISMVLNSMKPIWTRPKEEVTPAEYKELYQRISHDWNEPLLQIIQSRRPLGVCVAALCSLACAARHILPCLPIWFAALLATYAHRQELPGAVAAILKIPEGRCRSCRPFRSMCRGRCCSTHTISPAFESG
jgi:HSP90 family molecular chaperone